MSVETTTSYPSEKRASVAKIDSRIETAHQQLGEQFSAIKEGLNDSDRSLFYDEPSYAADILLSLPDGTVESEVAQSLAASTQDVIGGQNERSDYLSGLSDFEQKLFAPVPDYTWARSIKDTYRDILIDTTHPLHNEPVVSLRDYGIACQAYYSRRNGATGDPVPGVKPDVYVRKSAAEQIQKLNELLALPEATEYFGGEVEIFVDEGWRDPALQKYLYDDVIPNLIRNEFIQDGIDKQLSPEEFEAKVNAERDRKIARPPTNKNDSPSPHATGGTFDFAIRRKQQTLGIVPSVNIPMGRGTAQMTKFTNPDDFEHVAPENIDQRIAQQNRRAQHALLAMIGYEQNPTEFWHASRGDQLSSIVNGETPYYGWADHDGESEKK